MKPSARMMRCFTALVMPLCWGQRRQSPNPMQGEMIKHPMGFDITIERIGRMSWRFDIKRGLGRAVGPAPGLAKGARGREV